MIKVKELEKILKALASARRLGVVKFLAREEVGTVGELAEAIDLSYKSTSKHLAVLLAAGIVERQQQGPEASYHLAVALDPLVKYVLGRLK